MLFKPFKILDVYLTINIVYCYPQYKVLDKWIHVLMSSAVFSVEMKKAGTLNTPSIAFSNKDKLAFSATPCQGKNARKRLGLFSPASTRKGRKLVFCAWKKLAEHMLTMTLKLRHTIIDKLLKLIDILPNFFKEVN